MAQNTNQRDIGFIFRRVPPFKDRYRLSLRKRLFMVLWQENRFAVESCLVDVWMRLRGEASHARNLKQQTLSFGVKWNRNRRCRETWIINLTLNTTDINTWTARSPFNSKLSTPPLFNRVREIISDTTNWTLKVITCTCILWAAWNLLNWSNFDFLLYRPRGVYQSGGNLRFLFWKLHSPRLGSRTSNKRRSIVVIICRWLRGGVYQLSRHHWLGWSGHGRGGSFFLLPNGL